MPADRGQEAAHGRPFLLTAEDRQSSLWRRLLPELQRRREFLRLLNDHPADEQKTADTRGRIAELSRLIALDDLESKGNE